MNTNDFSPLCRIEYFSGNVSMPTLKRRLLKEWIIRVAASRGRRVGEICYQFCSDEEILEANNRFLGHDYYTDIITFDDSIGETINGQMLISLDTVRSNAKLFGCTYRRELHRVLIHGILHLCGQGDKTEDEEREMHRLEDEALALYDCMLSEV
ncbi:rRNA maturation factor [Porphyromonas crevioricanis]|uniref:Endoribonuclease YbeY n=3 Tax=Porphyromonas crevioricanis TaxID=393921 RepID=A0A0A2FDW0_9PORP|nr:rRNA maturation RNase YbeY [Porphyromonas crevioricanis]GAD05195.1 metal-dependent hydrolase [Porphyromonas crevioricanis JCM 15906]KGN89188.1 rRNA maturation factor [Porphyromonas crevioricanis]SJZ99826.1 rRNA maturation RNase YbeY [Porphyromonas crevioricanis]SQH72448.1 Probable rRNA maturation factor [Porphyromonas crevioricanis]GAD06471.1 metal-dependent hydrolase [Porphyromonas crevioricanis JCM 13913]